MLLSNGGAHRQIVGTPEQIADNMEYWFTTRAADGFNLNFDVFPGGLELFVEHVTPELRRRGLFRSEYPGTTLRDSLGLPGRAASTRRLPSADSSRRQAMSADQSQHSTQEEHPVTGTVTHQRRLGTDGPLVSPIGLGFMSFVVSAEAEEESRAVSIVDRAIDLGITLFDTADVYGPEFSEILLGRAIRGRRDSLTIATKFGNALDRDTNPGARKLDARPEYVRSALEASLRRLGTDYVDLYYLHRVDPAVPIEDTFGALKELVEAGKVRYLGLSEPGPQTIRRAHAVHPVTALQNEWSLFSREIESAAVPLARELGIGIVPYSPLGRGWLTGTLRTREDLTGRRPPPSPVRRGRVRGQPGARRRGRRDRGRAGRPAQPGGPGLGALARRRRGADSGHPPGPAAGGERPRRRRPAR